MRVSEEFKNRFQELVEDEEIGNKAETAEKMGISYVTFSKMYNYGIVPKVSILIKIADFFNVSIEYLLAINNAFYFNKSLNPSTFRERFLALKEEKGVRTIYEFAEISHIHRNIIARWVNLGYLPELDNLENLADYFKVSLDYLLGRTDDKKND